MLTLFSSLGFFFVIVILLFFRGADIIRKIVEQRAYSPVEVYDEKGDGKVGIWTTDVSKESAANHLKLMLSNGQVAFAKEFITQEKETSGKSAAKTIQDVYREQLANYRVELVIPHDVAIGITRRKFTGKTSSGRKGTFVLLFVYIFVCRFVILVFVLFFVFVCVYHRRSCNM